MSPNEIRDWLSSEGYRAKLEEDADEATISSAAQGIGFDIIFHRSDPPDGDLDAFESLSFVTGGPLDAPLSIEAVNNFNSEFSFVKAYVDDQTLFLVMEQLASSNRLSENEFGEMFGYWAALLPEFVKIFPYSE